jgi:hypothetical protein
MVICYWLFVIGFETLLIKHYRIQITNNRSRIAPDQALSA